MNNVHVLGTLLGLVLLASAASAQDFPLNGIPQAPQAPQAGQAVDARGNQAIDPTQNVLNALAAQAVLDAALRESDRALANKEIERLDDLREAEARLAAAERMAIEKRTNDLRDAAILQRNEALDAAEKLSSSRFLAIEKQAELERQSSALLRDTETKRVNDVLAVTAKALETATTAQTETAKTLAAQVQSLATGLASQVDTAATATATNLQRVEERIAVGQSGLGDRLTLLEQFQNQGAGRQSAADPQLAATLAGQAAILERLVAAQATGSGRDEGQTATIAFIFAGIGTLAAILAIIGAIITAVVKGGRKDDQPRIVYVPSAPGMPPVVAAPQPQHG